MVKFMKCILRRSTETGGGKEEQLNRSGNVGKIDCVCYLLVWQRFDGNFPVYF